MKNLNPTRVLLLLILTGLALVWAACSDDTTEPPQAHNQLTGTVVDADGNPIADAGILMVFEPQNPSGRPSTEIAFVLPETTQVLMAILSDVYQDTVRTAYDGLLPPGSHAFLWDGRDSEGLIVPSGVYYYVLIMGDDVSDAAIAVMHDWYAEDADPAQYRFLTRTAADGTFSLEQGPLNFDYPFNQYDEEGNITGTWAMPRTVRFFAMADGYLTGHSDWAEATVDSGCRVAVELAPSRR